MKIKKKFLKSTKSAQLNSDPNVRMLPMSSVIIPKGRTTTTDIDAMAESISMTGLMNPITVRKLGEHYELVGGFTRYQVYKKLGLNKIPANILILDNLQAQLAEKDENLYRKHYTTLELCEVLKSRRKLMEKNDMIAKRGGDRKSKEIKGRATPVDSFAESASKITGLAQRTINEYVKIADDIPSELIDKLRSTEVAKSKSELNKISKMPTDEQVKITDLISSGEAKSVLEAKRIATPSFEPPQKSKVLSQVSEFFGEEQFLRGLCEVARDLAKKLPAKKVYFNKNRRKLSEQTDTFLKIISSLNKQLKTLREELSIENKTLSIKTNTK